MDDFAGESFLTGGSFNGIAVAKGNNDPKSLIKDDSRRLMPWLELLLLETA